MRTTNKSLCLLLVVLFLGLSNELRAQLVEGIEENYWESAHNSSEPFEEITSFIGNHPCLDLQSADAIEKLKTISSEPSGTLFLVAKLKAQLSDALLLQVGSITVRADSIFSGSFPIGAQTLTETPFLLKINYQVGYKRKWDKTKVFISEHLAVAEILHFKEQLDQEQSRKVESYLALKYSINITQNTDASLRDYQALGGSQYWTEKSDGAYNQEVLSLGRLDKWRWQQSQTYSANSKSIALSLQNTATLGEQPLAQITDGSVLVVSKSEIESFDPNCTSPVKKLPWKFNFYNWKSDAKKLHLSWEATETLQQAPHFTNGLEDIELSYTQKDNRVSVTIPISQVKTLPQETWFLVWDQSLASCTPLASLELTRCSEQADETNALVVRIDETQLPATYQLKDVKSGEEVSGTITSAFSELRGIPSSQYHFSVYNNEQKLFEEVLKFPACIKPSNETLLLSTLELVALPNEQTEEDNWFLSDVANDAIVLYPNPVKTRGSITATFGSGLLGVPFEVEIVDRAGKILSIEHFTPELGNQYHNDELVTPGTYFIKFKSASTIVVKQIVVL